MIRCRDDRLFERFKRHGDAKALGEFCDRTAPELLRVARYLVGDLAEDVVQESYLVAMQDHSSWDSRRPVRPWLLGILSNQARRARRTRAREVETDRIDATAPLEPIDSARGRELESALHAALAKLPKSYAATLRHHLVHGQAAAEIAEREGVSGSTVRMRIHRGMERLRHLLPVGFTAGAIATAAPSAQAIANVKAQVLAAAAPGTKISTVSSGLLLGGIVTKKLILIVAAAIACLGFLMILNKDPNSRQLAEKDGSPASIAATDAPTQPVDPIQPQGETVTEGRQPLDPPSPPSTLRLRLVMKGTPIPVAGLSLICQGRPKQAQRTDAEGRISFRGTPRFVTVVSTDAGAPAFRKTFASIAPDAPEILVEVPAKMHLTLRVVNEQGSPAPNAVVWWLPTAPFPNRWSPLGTTNAAGTLVLPTLATSAMLRAHAESHVPSAPADADAMAGIQVERELVLRGPARRLTGTVVDAKGQPVPHARLAIQEPRRGGLAPSPIFFDADGSGRFATHEMTQAACSLIAIGKVEGDKRVSQTSLPAGPGPDRLEIRVGPGATVQGVVTGPDDIAGTLVRAMPSTPNLAIELQFDVAQSAQVAPDGSFRLEGILPGTTMLAVRRGNDQRRRNLKLRDGQVVDWNPSFAPTAKITLRLLGPKQAPLSGWKVYLLRGQKSVSTHATDPQGRCVITTEIDATHRLRFQAPRCSRSSLEVADIRAASHEQIFTVDAAKMPNAKVRGRVVATDGSSMEKLRVLLMTDKAGPRGDRGAASLTWDQKTGRFSFSPLIPGGYMVAVARGPRVIASTLPQKVAPNGTLDVGDISVQAPQDLKFRFPAGFAPGDLTLGIVRGGEFFALNEDRAKRVGDEYQVADIPNGSFDFGLWGPGVAFQKHRVDTGRTRLVACTPRRVATLKLRFQTAFHGSVQFERNGGGFTLAEPCRFAPGEVMQRGLPPGTYKVTCTPRQGTPHPALTVTMKASGMVEQSTH